MSGPSFGRHGPPKLGPDKLVLPKLGPNITPSEKLKEKHRLSLRKIN